VIRYSDHYIVEIAIPLKTLRFKKGISQWGINFIRDDPGENTTDVWSPIPRQFDPTDLGYTGTMSWDQIPTVASSNISLIPYASLSTNKNFEPNTPSRTTTDLGGDAKIAITSGLNLDLTVNPDFSQVEVDAQVTNLTRFNIFFPERRQFFIENGDIFLFGQNADQPFYSRRIGLNPNGHTVPILAGARLTGNLTDNLRIGVMNMHTKSSDENAGQNYSAASFQYRIGTRSSFRGLFLNRQGFDGTEAITGDYGRNLGGELNLVSNDGVWSGQAALFKSFKNNISDNEYHTYGRVAYNGQLFQTFLTIQDVGANYYSDMGFNSRVVNFNPLTDSFERIGFTQIGNMMDLYVYTSGSEKVNFHWSGLENFVWFSHGSGLNEWYTRLRHFIFYKNSSQLRFRLNNNYIELLFPFVLTDNPLPAKRYNMTEFNIEYRSGFQKAFNYEIFAVYGEFYDGTKLTYRLNANYRLQPWLNVSMGLENNHIRLDPVYGNADLTLATARMEVNFNTTLFWTTFVQYNTQSDNFNINTRLQWRYAPMSDIFVVYTDNYLIDGKFGPQNRSFVIKANYWLSI
jgi:hypothetical protein